MPTIGAGGIYLRPAYPPALELGFARGPMPGGLSTPRPLSPAQQIYGRSEVLGVAETVGETGASQAVASGAPINGRGAPAGGPAVRGAGGVVLNIVVSAAVRAAGLPGIVASALNFIIGTARRSAGTSTMQASGASATEYAPSAFGDLLRDRDPWAMQTAELRAESAARGTRIDALLATFEDTGDDVLTPEPVPSGVPEEQSLPSPGLDTETGAPYGSGEPPAQDAPGPDAPV